MRGTGYLYAAVFTLTMALPLAAQKPYFPGRSSWQHKTPAEAGFDAARLQSAIAYAQTQLDTTRTDSAGIANSRPTEKPYNATVGPWLAPHGPEGGMIVRHGYVVAEWGDPKKVDMTFSVTKSFLSTIAALAVDAGKIKDLSKPVSSDVAIPEFTSDPHNARITWHHLLQQTSEWQGTLWDKPDWADRFNPRTGKRAVLEPGSKWTYNDVRVNVLALALLNVWRRPLPEVLKEKIMDPIGASSTWRWYGYNNSYVTIDGKRMQSVSGGGHWGGGFQINAEDMARYGLLFLHKGNWNGKQLVSEKWVELATKPSEVKSDYGYLWWLNATGTISSAPRSAFSAQGAGGNYIYVDPEHDLVVVLRWTRDFTGVMNRILTSINE